MSTKNSPARRIGLLTSSSLVAAGLMALAGAALAPTAVLAQAACVTGAPPTPAPTDNGTAAVTLPAGTYNPGVTCVYTGTGATVSTAGAITVSATAGGDGVNLSATGASEINWVSTAGQVTGGAQTNGPVIDASSASGAINITTAAITGTNIAVTHGIRATSTGGGAITISAPTGAININSNTAGAQQQSAITAISTGGAGAVSVTTGGTVTGRVRGIEAQSSGTGALTITATGAVNVNNGAGVAVATIDARTGTGLLTVNINTGAGVINGQGGNAILTNAGGGAAINIAAGRTVQAGALSPAVMNLTAAGTTTVTNAGAINASTAALLAIRAAGGGFVLNNTGSMRGRVDLSALTGAATVTIGQLGSWFTGPGVNAFGAGASILNNQGVVAVGGVATFTGLDQFNNSGVIYMGGASGTGSDGVVADVLSAVGAAFVGSGSSRIVLDANLGSGAEQTSCAAITSADCLDFTGGSTGGSTLLTIRDVSFDPAAGSLNPITVVAGSSAADHFTLDPASDHYASTSQGSALRKPLVAYHLTYDAANERHVLVGIPTDEAYQAASFGVSAQEVWRATTGSWLTRQADLRAAPEGLQSSNGVWARLGASTAERSADSTYTAAGAAYAYDLGNKQTIAHLVVGGDMLRGGGGDQAWVLGGMLGFVRSDVEYDVTPTNTVSTGFTGGVYASYLAGPLFVDGVVNLNLLHVKFDAPEIGLGLEAPITQDLKSLGAQVEAGWRIGADGGPFVEPLVGVSYVVTRFDDADIAGVGSFDFDDKYTSLRIGGGLRFGLDTNLVGIPASFGLTGRYWNESEGDNETAFVALDGSRAQLTDEFGGGFSEVAASTHLFSSDGMVSGFVNVGAKFAGGYSALDGAVGVRLRW